MTIYNQNLAKTLVSALTTYQTSELWKVKKMTNVVDSRAVPTLKVRELQLRDAMMLHYVMHVCGRMVTL